MEKILGSAAIAAVKEAKANCIILLTKKETKPDKLLIDLKIAREKDGKMDTENRVVEIDPLPIGTIAEVRMILRQAVDAGFLNKGDALIALIDESLGIGFEGLFLFFKIDDKFMELTERELKRELKKSVYDSVLGIAREISKEGREGRQIGTAFIIGDHENVLKKSKQLILNPLEGHPIEKRNITDTNFKETIKELAQLDGVFIIDQDGYIHSAGRFLIPETTVELNGLGCRHQACAAITKETNSVAVCVSESGGTIRVFRNGNLILEEKL